MNEHISEPRCADESVISADLPTPELGQDRSMFTRLLAADKLRFIVLGKVLGREQGLLLTFGIGVGVVAAALLALYLVLPLNTWSYEFLFRRGFVQGVLLVTFAIGLIHLLRRIPVWRFERRALQDLQVHGTTTPGPTMVQRRWSKVCKIDSWGIGHDSRLSTKNLAEYDEAELDAAYRLPSDVVQILPLMGFFGTVFGLSHGLYQSFLAAGSTTSKDFAKAIAIAFDNTLLGLGLTIILFIALNLLRKQEDSLLLQLNLFVDSWLLEHAGALATPPHQLSGAIEQIDRSLQQFNEQMEADQATAAEALNRLAKSVGTAHDSLSHYGQSVRLIHEFAAKMEQKIKDFASTSEHIVQLGEAMTAVRGEVAAVKSSVDSVQSGIETLDTSIGKVDASVGTTSSVITSHFNTLHQQLDGVQMTTASLPGIAREVGDQIVTVLRADLGDQAGRIRDEIRRPRRIQIVESTEATDEPGDTTPS